MDAKEHIKKKIRYQATGYEDYVGGFGNECGYTDGIIEDIIRTGDN